MTAAEPLRHALVIVDVQNGFLNEHTEGIPESVEALQAHYDTIFVTRFSNRPGSPFRRWLDWHAIPPSSPESELAFTPAERARVLDKTVYTCVDESFLEALDRAEVAGVDIVGLDTDTCVLNRHKPCGWTP